MVSGDLYLSCCRNILKGIVIYICMDKIPEDVREFMTKSEEERSDILERRVLTFSLITGNVFSSSIYCGNTFVSESSARRHIRTSKKCIANRRTIHDAASKKP